MGGRGRCGLRVRRLGASGGGGRRAGGPWSGRPPPAAARAALGATRRTHSTSRSTGNSTRQLNITPTASPKNNVFLLNTTIANNRTTDIPLMLNFHRFQQQSHYTHVAVLYRTY